MRPAAAGFVATGGGTVNVTGTGNTIDDHDRHRAECRQHDNRRQRAHFPEHLRRTAPRTASPRHHRSDRRAPRHRHWHRAGPRRRTIGNKTGADGSTATAFGIYLNSTADVQLAWMQLNDFRQLRHPRQSGHWFPPDQQHHQWPERNQRGRRRVSAMEASRSLGRRARDRVERQRRHPGQRDHAAAGSVTSRSTTPPGQ